MLSQLKKFLNKSEQSPVKLTSLVAVTLLTYPATTSSPHLLSLLNSPQLSVNAPVSLSKVYLGIDSTVAVTVASVAGMVKVLPVRALPFTL